MSEAFAADKIIKIFDNNPMDFQYMLEERIIKTMVGRGSQTEMFKKQFDRVLEGGMGLTIVSGRPGIGKSFFVERAAGTLTVGSATYVRGKFRQYDKGALIAFSEIIEQAVRHVLTLPGPALKNIKNNLTRKLGADASIILSVCPYAQILLGTHKAVHADNLEKLKYRARKAVYQFLATVSTALFPLIIFIDDLQWADSLSLNIIEMICQDYEFLNLHLVLAWREDGRGRAFLNPAKLPMGDDIRIELGGLMLEDINQYVRLVFAQDIEHKDYLIRMLYGLTLGNPFNISRVLRLFLQENVLAYSAASKWLVRHDKMKDLNLPADIEQLLTRQIDALTTEDKELLNLTACCGGAAFELLQVLTGEDKDVLSGRLDGLCKNALLVKIVSDSSESYGFAHDIVLRLVYSNLAFNEKSKLHYRIAETLTAHKDKIPATGGGLDIAAHLLKSDMPLLKENRTEQWTRELYKAGVSAKQGAAAEQALEIFQRCGELLSFISPEGKNESDISVRLELSECLFICGQEKDARAGFEDLLVKYPETENQIKIKRKYISLCAMSGDFEKVMELGLQILAHLNLALNPKYSIIDLMKSRLLFSAGKIDRLETAPAITHQRLLYILETLIVMAPSVNCLSDEMSAMIALKLAVLSARHGNSDYAPVAYAGYSYLLFHILKDHKRGKRLLEVTHALLERCENPSSKSAAYCILGSLAHHCSNSLESTVGCLARSIEEGEKEGGSLYGSYAITFTIITKYMMGIPLGELKQYIDDCRKKQSRLEHYLTSHFCDIYENHIGRLENGIVTEKNADLKEYKYKELFTDTLNLNRDIIALARLCLEGRRSEAWRLAEDIESKIGQRDGFIVNIEFLFYSTLARLAVHQDLSGTEKRRNKRVIEKHLRALKYTVSVYPDNHRARYLLAQAEYDALFAPKKASDRLYQEAMDFAEKQGNLSLEALANLLAAKFHRGNLRLSSFYTTEAVRLYKKWGAAYIGDLIAENMGLSAEAACSSEMPVAHPGTDMADNKIKTDRDVLFHLGKIEKMREDEGYLYLLNLLARHEDPDYCAVFFEKSDEMYLKYDKRKGNEACAYQDLTNTNHLSSLPHKIIRYVARTETEILLDRKALPGIFVNDPYLKDKDGLSLICLPVKYSGVLIGIVYLEKLGKDGFGDNLPAFVKGFLPSLLAKQTNTMEMNLRNILNPPHENSLFTKRELEVLKLVAQGLSNSEISGELHITLGTVKTHLRNIYAKLETDNRVKAVTRARELKIIQV